MRILYLFLMFNFIGLSFCFPQTRNSHVYPLDESTTGEVRYSAAKGLKWLIRQQGENGAWLGDPAITGLVLSAIIRSGPSESIMNTNVVKGLSFLSSCIKPDGSIYLKADLQTYTTSIVLRTFKDANQVTFQKQIKDAEHFLLTNQFNESNGYSSDSLQYGGIGYGNVKTGKQPNISTLQWAMVGLEDKPKKNIEVSQEEKELLKAKAKFKSRVLEYLKRCQNLKSVNPNFAKYNDGGFIYAPGESKAEQLKSYGSMTYAGLLSMIFADLDKTDPRVTAALNWISKTYNIKENPGMGCNGLYYYYHSMAKALHAYGNWTIKDSSAQGHNWAKELTLELMSKQNPEGFWINDKCLRWWEDQPVLVTAYVILTMEEILPEPVLKDLISE
ncbi:MAG: prenyltransferase/squalene oxidase repeat-containing protein [Bacteroidota bacterium]